MTILLIALVCFLFLAWLSYHLLYVKKRSKKLTRQKFKSFEELIRKLGNHQVVAAEEIARLAYDPSTRHPLFGILERFGRSESFPKEFFTLEHSAESFMVTWLEFPTELNATPEKIQLLTKVNLPEDPEIEYFVFKFKKGPSVYGFDDEWMLGVVGPFDGASQPYEVPARVFSRFNAVGTVSALQEAQWVHHHINRK